MADPKKKTLKETLDEIPFKNKDIQVIAALKSENMKLKDQLGRKSKSSSESSTPVIRGLQTLKGDLGGQFLKTKAASEYIS